MANNDLDTLVKVNRHAELIAAWSFFGQSSTPWNICQSMQHFAHHGLHQAYKNTIQKRCKYFMVCSIVQRRIKLLMTLTLNLWPSSSQWYIPLCSMGYLMIQKWGPPYSGYAILILYIIAMSHSATDSGYINALIAGALLETMFLACANTHHMQLRCMIVD